MRIGDAKIAIALLLFAVPLVAQSPAAQDSGQAGTLPVFRSHTELVLVPVVVTDKSGHHVTGLHKEDFRVDEDGHEQKVAFFDEVKTSPELLKRASVPQDEYTNALANSDPTRRLTILVLDTINTPAADQQRARKAVLNFLEQNVNPNEPISLLSITSGGVRVLHDFTTSPAELVAALKQVKSGVSSRDSIDLERQLEHEKLDSVRAAAPGAPLSLGGALLFDARALIRLQREEDSFIAFQQRVATEQTLRALQQIARAFAGIPGRKSMLWATGGIPFVLDDPRAFGNMNTELDSLYQETWGALNSANMAVYPIDLTGLVTDTWDTQRRSMTRGLIIAGRGGVYTGPQITRTDLTASLRTFASITGGTACINNNDVKHCFEAAHEDSSQYYLMSYYSHPSQAKAEWRKLKVRVSKAGVQVRARDGYLARPFEDPRKTRSSDLSVALSSPLDYTALPLVVKWKEASASPAEKDAKRQVGFMVYVPRVFIDDSEKNHVMLDLAIVARQPSGKVLSPISRVLDTHLEPSAVEEVRKLGFKFGHEIELPPGEYNVRFVVRDNLSGQMGSVAAPLTVK